MKEQFVTYEIALKLKELGFDYECLKWSKGTKDAWAIEINYIKNSEDWICNNIGYCTIPLWQQAIDWFREKHNIMIHVQGLPSTQYMFSVYKEVYNNDPRICGNNFYKAREKAVLKAIELCQKE